MTAASQELDFAPGIEAPHRHIFLIYSLDGCVQCEKLFDAMREAHGLVLAEERSHDISVFAKKIDCTTEARTNKAALVHSLVQNYGYCPREDGRVLFPVCVYNGKAIGGYRECYVKFCSVIDEYVD